MIDSSQDSDEWLSEEYETHRSAQTDFMRGSEEKMEIEMTEPIVVEEGKHTGQITKVEYRDTPYKYTDVFVKVDGHDFELRYGTPTNLNVNTKLGRLLAKFVETKVGEKYDPEQILVGKKVSFMTLNEEKEGNTFSKIVEDSLKPMEEN